MPAKFVLHTTLGAQIRLEMPDRQLKQAFDRRLASTDGQPKSFTGKDSVGQGVTVDFQTIAVITEQAPPADAGLVQQSPALAGRPLTGS